MEACSEKNSPLNLALVFQRMNPLGVNIAAHALKSAFVRVQMG